MKSIILLSGGLDSLVVLGLGINEYNIELALTFDYGQKSAKYEIDAAKKQCERYNIQQKIIKLDWLKEITKTSLVSELSVPESEFGTKESAENVWVPNRNGLFLNIAAAYADSYNYDCILFGANKDEGCTFPDNTDEFRKRISETFEYSTLKKPKVSAPLINYSKDDIVKIAIEHSMPLELVRSCYNSENTHCGMCESCNHLKKALINNHAERYINILFKHDED